MPATTKETPKKTPGRKPAAKKAAPKVEAPKVETPKPEKLKDGDMVMCMNMYPGSQIVFGKKTNNIYRFDGTETVEPILYEDLRSEALNRRSGLIYSPSIVVQDERFIDEFPRLRDVYAEAYSPSRMKSIISKNNGKVLEEKIRLLPENVIPNFKTVVASMIAYNELDSISKLKIIDRILDTDFAERE